jgi:hypothetical protein
MAKRIEIINDPKSPQAPVNQSKADRQAFVDVYAKQNPVKFALKEKALKAWVEAA